VLSSIVSWLLLTSTYCDTTMPEPTNFKCIKLLLPHDTVLSGLAIGCRYDNPVTVVSVVKFTHDNRLTTFKEFQILVGDSEGYPPHAGHLVSSKASQTNPEGSREGKARKGSTRSTIIKREELVNFTCHCAG